MKRLPFIVAASCFLFAVPAFAAEKTEPLTEETTETEYETAEEETEIEFEKGSRMNPYKLGEEAHLGTVYEVYDGGCEFVDVTITLDEVLDSDDLEESYPDDSISNGDYFVVKGTLSTAAASTDDDDVYMYLNVDGYSSQLDDCSADICDYSNAESISDVFSYFDYDIIIKCDLRYCDLTDVQYIRFGFYPTEESYDWENGIYDEHYVWIELE